MTLTIINDWKCCGGRQQVVRHESTTCGVPMQFSIFLPPGYDTADGDNPPVLYFLSGLTCTWANVTEKGGFQRAAAEMGVAVVCPDTSPRGEDIHDADDRWDLGTGAGFYVDADNEPWSAHYKMYSYVVDELPALLDEHFDVDTSRQSVTGHSMGGHGALVVGLRNPGKYKSISAFSPVVAPSQVQWGQDAFEAYLSSREDWSQYDATELVREHARDDITIHIEQGTADSFLEDQLKPELFVDACAEAGQPVKLNRREGYDHSYYFISSFLPQHVELHAKALGV
jgi:S-formylglutathione hydrolase